MNKVFKIPTTIYQLLKKLRLRTYIALGLIAVLLPIAFFSLYHPGGSEAAWWNESWQYRKRIPITAHAAEETNVYISITNYNASDTTRYQADCGDMRFTKQNGELLPYYVANCGVATTIHVNFDVFPAGAQDIYLYYGNPSAENGFNSTDFSTEATNYTLGTIASEEVTPGPVAEWKFDEGSGQTAQDSTSNNNDGQLGSTSSSDSNDPTWRDESMCISGKCLEFDGTDDYVVVSNTLNDTQTVSFWVRPTTNSEHIAKLTINGEISISSGIVTLGSAFTNSTIYVNGLPSSQLPATNYWSHIAITFDAMEADDVYLGYSGSDYLDGFIDEVKIYPYARSPEQIKADYNQGAAKLGIADQGSLSDGLVGYWSMDESSGTTVADKSGNGNNGTLTNAQETGTSDASGNTTTTLVDTDGTLSTTDDAYNGMILRFTAACGSITSGTERVISDYTGATKTFTVGTALAASPNSCAYEVRHQVGGKFGNGVGFDGDNDYVNIPHDSKYLSYPLTINSWFKTSSTSGTPGIVNKYPSGSKNGYQLFMYAGKLCAWYFKDDSNNIFDGSNCTFNISGYNDNQWHMATFVVSESGGSLYVDGVLKGQRAWKGTPGVPNQVQALYIGYYSSATNDNFPGSIDEVRIYNRALSASEVKQLYEWAPGPENYLNMDEGAGTTLNDSSGNSRNGTLNNGTWNTGKYGKGVNLDGTGDYVEINDY